VHRLLSVSVTEITVATGERYQVGGLPEEVESAILAAARGSIMQLAWLTEAGSGRAIGVNPAHLVTLRAASSVDDPPPPG
jgi:hypothetical protein